MLRLFKQYYPARNAIFVVGEGLIVFLSVIAASWIRLGTGALAIDIWIPIKAILITTTCQACQRVGTGTILWNG